MAVATTDTTWTVTLTEGAYDFQKRGFGDVYVGRGSSAPTDLKDALFIEDRRPFRLTVAPEETAYFYGDGVEIYYYQIS